ncbi:hypothetical protein KC717_05155 [Candidatus Dojkabacteria bacterium]|uniref:Inositol monophosphatase n=1 Tax=Candidatus Dojkabacteria bacterium TaxID=2099670 RepID=A0A955RL53_9BACT|nr:hypothetical protein [Candidatus Dojkabacteria bacterium]
MNDLKKFIEKETYYIGLKLKNFFDHEEVTSNSISEIKTKLTTNLIRTIKKQEIDVGFIEEYSSSEDYTKKKNNLHIHILDGSGNMLRGIPYFGTTITLSSRGSKGVEPIFSCMYLPNLGEMLTSEKGEGTKINGKNVNVSRIEAIENSFGSIAPTMDEYMSSVMSNLGEISQTSEFRLETEGTGLYNVRYLVNGNRDFWVFKHDPEVDYSYNLSIGAKLMIEEAGGKVTKLDGSEWHVGDSELLASNKLIHNYLVGI